jgi:hypothetical protein
VFLEKKRFHHSIRFAGKVLFCGFIVSMACITSFADTSTRLVIVNAVYGDLSNPAATTNVTKTVAAMVDDNTLNFHPNNNTLGGDPAPNTPKQFKVDYTIDGVADTKTANEGSRVKISANPPAPPKKSRLVIVKAFYGDLPNGQAADVTADLTEMITNNGLEVMANNNTFGDTAWGVAKRLRVDYTFDGWKKSVTVEENEALSISPSVELAEHHKRIFFFFLWTVSGILVVSAMATAAALLVRKWKK